ncbi:HpcH/HpaI aldolase/citrate lyase family protein [Mycobacterium frederiksbergense]|uniref:HpcH/HpaI aldolase/citrate lyase family protein n=1 Tax=Mycolicibacterium frederiksbergense TaxID=117567 RepID=UPI0021F342A5|nr:HpcH/HpaI aldolase/citrate lyase family protein [Mycolicibacterium frederiksbergense]MCV7045996.1 HpcH/HpaI aldolase/citrate lyase family protein [Mycolicibacterium frederiksbergense]
MTAIEASRIAVRHFHHLSAAEHGRLFYNAPEELTFDDERDVLATALGATLYMPANRADLAATVIRRSAEGICSMVLDLEDAVEEAELASALHNAVTTLNTLAAEPEPLRSMVFIRVRSLNCIKQITDRLDQGADVLCGFVVPKFDTQLGELYLDQISTAARILGRRLYCMPVLESEQIIYRETRQNELLGVCELLARHRDSILAVRVGATDLCGTYGIRRDRDHTIYDVHVVASAIADIVNHVARTDGTGFVVTAPVWEYFADHERLFRTLLRTTPFQEHDAVRFRDKLVNRDLDGLLREISLDRANGLTGKTVIHPSHAPAVHALSVVTHEEYRDATDIATAGSGGVRRSEYRNKMNEARPHRIWAQQVLRRARVFGVANEGVTFVDFLTRLAPK